MKSYLVLIVAAVFLTSCNHASLKFQKGSILDVTMDPNKTASPSKSFHSEPVGIYEKGSLELGGSYGSSCPTCG